jgi:hypothetical protein
MGLAVNIVFFKSKQAFWYSFIERLYELSQKSIAEVRNYYTTQNILKLLWCNPKLYKAVGWDATNQKYTGKTEPVKMGSYSLYLHLCISITQHVNVAGVECQTCQVQEYEIQKQFAFNNGLVYRLSQKTD